MDYRGLMRRKMLEDIYDRMSDDEKRAFVQLTLQDRDHKEIMEALQKQGDDLHSIRRNQNWFVDFGSDVTANLFTDALIWIGSRLFKK
jgi:hypothetical protein